MKIRKATYEDLDKLVAVYSYAKQFMEEHGNKNQWSGKDAITKEKVKQLIDRQKLFVGEEDAKIQFAFAYILGEDPTYKVITEGAWLNDLPYGTIHRVASAGTTKGVVKIISDWALEQNPNLKIDTHHDNIVMQKALEKNGFTRCGIIFLESGDPRIAYQKVKNKMENTMLVTDNALVSRNSEV